MPELIVNQYGETRPVEDLSDIWQEFKQSGRAMPASRLDYRRTKRVVSSQYFYDFIESFAKRGKEFPKRGTHEYDRKLDELWKKEPILAGTVYGMVAKAQSKPWQIEGGRNNSRKSARMLANAKFSYWKAGWWGFAGMSALDFYTTRLGTMWGMLRRDNAQFGQLIGLEHIDSLSCYLTGSVTKPVRYESAETGQTIFFKNGEILNITSLGLSREKELGAGFCAVERALQAARVLVLLLDYDEEKLLNLPPEGIASVSGLTQDEFLDAIAMWQEARKGDGSLTFPQVLWLLSQQPGQNVNVDVASFSNLPEQFNRESVVNAYVNTLANAFGVSASDIWFMGGGPFGTGKEAELQHVLAKGKGEGEWFSVTTEEINKELPEDVVFTYNTQDIGEDLIAAQTAQAWITALQPLFEQSETLQIDGADWKRLFVSKGVLPEWMGTQQEDARTIIGSGDLPGLLKEEADDIVCFVYELGKLQQYKRPVISTYRRLKQEEAKPVPAIRGTPIPLQEAEAGARVTKKAIESELAIWKDIPELKRFVETTNQPKP